MPEGVAESIKVAVQWLFAPLLAIVALAWMCIRLEASGTFDAICSTVRKMPVGRRFVFLALAAGLIAYAGTKTNSPPMNLPGPVLPHITLPIMHPPSPLPDSSFILDGETSGPCTIVPPPAGAVTQEMWRLRGAHEDHVRIPSASGWSVLTPSGRVDSLDVIASGGFGVSSRNSFYPPPFADGLSLVPAANWNALAGEERASIFWHALTPSNSLLATWQDALLGRSATNIVSFQAEFQPGGGFEYRYSDRCVSYSPVPPFDLDCDGLENSVDPNPLVPGSDAHGTNAEWYNIVCSNVLAAAEGQDGVELSWIDGVNSNAYFFAEVVADIGPAAVYFTCDTETSLGSPVVVARAGETNRVPLLVGVGYSVSSDVPFSVSVPDGATAVSNGVSAFLVERPVSFEFVQDANALATGVVAYAVLVDPPGLEGSFAWESNGQPLPQRGGIAPLRAPPMRSGSGGGCSFVGFGNYVIFTCGEGCSCGGCEAVGSYTYENVCVQMSGGACGCIPENTGDPEEPPQPPPGPPPPDPPTSTPSVSVSFSTSAVIFEDRYENLPGVWVEKRSTQTTLTVEAQGGEHGCTVTVTAQNIGKLAAIGTAPEFPMSFSVGANETIRHTFAYEAVAASGSENDIRVTASFVGNAPGEEGSSSAALTAVKVEIEPVEEVGGMSNRHDFGVREMVSCFHYPASGTVTWTVSGGGTISETSPGFWTLFCNLTGDSIQLTASFGGVNHVFQVGLYEPAGLRCDGVQVIRDASAAPGVAGGAGMALTLYVIPESVSFRRISVEEVPSLNGTHSGYFANPLYYDRWSHQGRWGAGNWIGVGVGNFWCVDRTRMMVGCWFPPWSQGEMTWAIPMGWNESGTTSGTLPAKNFPVEYASVWTIDSQGTMTKQKHGHIVSRTTNDVVHLDGVLVP